jgi:hypothetical protein
MTQRRSLLTDIEYPDEMHRVPVDDLREHDICGSCWCKPHLEVDECDEHGLHFRWYHRALDGRDYYVDGKVTLQ